VTWELATTHPNIEARIAAKLTESGFQLQLFFVRTMIVVRGVLVNSFKPAFPRYLFVRAESRWREILEISGVSGFLTDEEGYPAKVCDSVVAGLLARSASADGKTVLDVPPRQSKFKFGDNVQIISNSLISGRKGIFQNLSGDTHASVLIEVMGRFISFRVPESDLILSPTRVRKQHRRKWKKKPSQVVSVRPSALIMPSACQ
jgi:transcription antitermination factor NusG